MNELSLNGLVTVESRIDRAFVTALHGQDLSGFEIWRWLQSGQDTANLLKEADLYPTLYRLEAERLLQSGWHEGERTRRQYRLTATALQRTDVRGVPPLAHPGGTGAASGAIGTHRTIGPDPESGSWFVPPRTEPPATGAVAATAPARGAGSSPDARRRTSDAPPPASSPADPGSEAIDGYAGDLDAALDLPRLLRSRVRQEIADHLTDSVAALKSTGCDAETATREAIDHLGRPLDLAIRIERAQQTKDRQNRSIRQGAITIVLEMLVWLVPMVGLITLAPFLADVAVALGSLAGAHLVVIRSGDWVTNQIAIVLCLGAFSAGRMSLGQVARGSRHRDESVRRAWAIGGGVALLVVALLLPGWQDALSVATFLGLPVAFVAGTFRPKQVNERRYSLRGVVGAALLAALFTLLPGGRLFAFDPNATPGMPLPGGRPSIALTWTESTDGTTLTYNQDVELWPATTEWLFVVVDPAASGPTTTPTESINVDDLPPIREWWVVAVVKNADGTTTATDVAIQPGATPAASTTLGWLISHL
jgi:hypothetical protein